MLIMRGLDGIYVCETRISHVDGEKGRLWYRGYPVDELAKVAEYEEVAYLLIYGRLPTIHEYKEFKSKLVGARQLPDYVFDIAEKLPRDLHPLDKLRVLVTILNGWFGRGEPILKGKSVDVSPVLETGVRLLGAMPRLAGIIAAQETGLKPPSEMQSIDKFAEYTLRVLTQASDVTEIEVKAFNTLLILYADHELPASTFAALVTASTLADVYSALTTALATLKGPLHGGALERVAKMLIHDIGEPSRAREYIERLLARGERIMGFGHRVYKTYDPRSVLLKRIAGVLARAKGSEARRVYETAIEVEKTALEKLSSKRIYPNVDFWAAVVLYALGIKPRYYTLVFAIARTAGWIAHIVEYVERNRLIRPRALYTGPLNLRYVPLEQRK